MKGFSLFALLLAVRTLIYAMPQNFTCYGNIQSVPSK